MEKAIRVNVSVSLYKNLPIRTVIAIMTALATEAEKPVINIKRISTGIKIIDVTLLDNPILLKRKKSGARIKATFEPETAIIRKYKRRRVNMFRQGDLVYYKKYMGEIISQHGYAYEVKLYNYRGLKMVCKTIPKLELQICNQIKISGF